MKPFTTINPVQEQRNFIRQTQRDIVPDAIKNRNLGKVIQSGDVSISSGTLSNGDQVVFTITTTARDDQKLLVAHDISVYVGSITSANELPCGSGIDESDWIVMGGWNNYGATDNNNVVTKVFVQNVAAGASQVVTCYAKARYISNTQLLT